jgi:hypothetical protein
VRASLEESRLTGVTFFVDRSLGQETVALALKAKGVLVERHDDHFAQNTSDDVWLPVVGARGWVVLSKDKRIRYRHAEREAVRTAAVALFVFLGGNMRAGEIAQTIAGALPLMNGMLATQKRPFLAGISKAGVVKLIEWW